MKNERERERERAILYELYSSALFANVLFIISLARTTFASHVDNRAFGNFS